MTRKAGAFTPRADSLFVEFLKSILEEIDMDRIRYYDSVIDPALANEICSDGDREHA